MVLKRSRARFSRGRGPSWAVSFLLLSLAAHVAILGTVKVALPWLVPKGPSHGPPLTLVIYQPEPPPEAEPPEPERPEWKGQIVEVAPPVVEEDPIEADYLAEYANDVEEETRTERFEVNPEVLAREWSRDHEAEQHDVEDLNVEKPSTGATVGNHRFDPNVDGTLAAVPSPWKATNKAGTADPIPSSQRSATLAGAPQNDLLDEVIGKAVDLDTTRYPYAGYIDRIRRQVNYWWQQNLDNLPSSVRLAKSRYTTAVEVVLNADGALEHIEVAGESGSPELDDCVVRAFRLAAPFDNPPAGLVEKDGRVYLPEFHFTVQLQAAQMHYQGIDPRAGVQFPGILKSPR